MGMGDRRRRPRRRRRRRRCRRRIRLAALRRRHVLDIQAGERDLPHRPRRALAGRRSSDVRAVLERCEELREETDGYFDCEGGGSLDPSGLVKGWAVDRGGRDPRATQARGTSRSTRAATSSSAGSPSPATAGTSASGTPQRADRVAAVVEANDLAIATSGAYARGDHVVDPHTGRPPSGLLSVTIIGPELATADAYATAAFAMGAARAGVDGAARRLRGDVDPRERDSALDARLSRWRTSRSFSRTSGMTSSGSG